MNRPNERGSVIIWILIAVGLFAALGFVFSQNSRTSTSMLTDEMATAEAHELQDYYNTVDQAVKRLSLRGCADNEISYETPDGSYAAADAPADESCHVFRMNGGQVIYKGIVPAMASIPPTCAAMTDFFNCTGSVISTAPMGLSFPNDCHGYCETIPGTTCCYWHDGFASCEAYSGTITAVGLATHYAATCAP